MDKDHLSGKRREYGAKLVLMAVFLGGFGLAIWLGGRMAAGEFRPGWLDLALLGLATFRLGRLVAYDVVMEPLRQPVAQTVPDETGAGDNVEARGQGVQQALGQLISCPICAGTWIAALLTFGLYLLPGPTRLFLMATAAIGLAELFNSLTEVMCWRAQLSRTRTGAELRAMREHQEQAADESLPLNGSSSLWDNARAQPGQTKRS